MSVTEQELKAAAVAPRVTEEQVHANIAKEEFLYVDLLTICVLTLQNGFTVTGESACADPKNYNRDIGNRLAKSQAIGKIWPLMGYELKTRLMNGEPTQEKAETYIDRLRVEKAELRNKMLKLSGFLGSSASRILHDIEVKDLTEQYHHMERYHAVLSRRLERLGGEG